MALNIIKGNYFRTPGNPFTRPSLSVRVPSTFGAAPPPSPHLLFALRLALARIIIQSIAI